MAIRQFYYYFQGWHWKNAKCIIALNGKDAKISFLQTFKGVGDKYSRNMMMDICDPDFTDCMAIDGRINSVSKILKIIVEPTYAEHEKNYVKIAKDADITPWELDRLLYNNKDYFIDALK